MNHKQGGAKMQAKIVIVDDDEKITSMLRRSLAFEGYVVSIAHDGIGGLRLISEQKPDVIIVDVMMPQLDGWEVLRRIREAGIQTPIIMLTAKDDIQDRVKGLDLGADDYVVKPFALEELLARIRVLLRRNDDRTAQIASVLSFEDLRLDLDSREVYRAGQRIELTAKEFDLLHLFMSNPRKVLPRQLLMEKIWGYDFSGESNVLEVYIALLRQKIEEHGNKRLIQTIRGAGYVMKGEV
jgi:two-component system response regulator MprA